jgi:hypothetical protein
MLCDGRYSDAFIGHSLTRGELDTRAASDAWSHDELGRPYAGAPWALPAELTSPSIRDNVDLLGGDLREASAGRHNPASPRGRTPAAPQSRGATPRRVAVQVREVDSTGLCALECGATPNCTAWTLSKRTAACWLKDARDVRPAPQNRSGARSPHPLPHTASGWWCCPLSAGAFTVRSRLDLWRPLGPRRWAQSIPRTRSLEHRRHHERMMRSRARSLSSVSSRSTTE